MIGTVKWFASANQPWGYIRFVDEFRVNREIFAHYKNILPDNQENPKFRVLKAAQAVEFEIGPGFPAGKGSQALNIKVLNASGQPGTSRGTSPVPSP